MAFFESSALDHKSVKSVFEELAKTVLGKLKAREITAGANVSKFLEDTNFPLCLRIELKLIINRLE